MYTTSTILSINRSLLRLHPGMSQVVYDIGEKKQDFAAL